MKYLLILFLTLILTFNFFAQKKVLIELFTSEGCSSCPQADELLTQLSNKNPQIYLLSFQVDYWDYLGWKDPYSSKQNSQRQYSYTKLFHLSSAYTPQAVINGTCQVVGSNASDVNNCISKSHELSSFLNSKHFSLTKTHGKIEIESLLPNELFFSRYLEIVLIKKNAESQVIRGENKGRRLVHKNVVIQLNSLKKNEKTIFDLPKNAQLNLFELIAILKNNKTHKVLDVLRISL